MNKLLFWLSSFLPCRQIKLGSGPYLERYFIGEFFGVTFYLHRFVSSDTEHHLHNHPWGWGRALVLSGEYFEESVIDLCPGASKAGVILDGQRIRWWNRVNGNHFHRISNAKPGTWTLFFHGPRVDINGEPVTKKKGAVLLKGWGFLDQGYLVGSHESTVFTPMRSNSGLRWWLSAPKGRDTDRMPYGTHNHHQSAK